MAKRLFAADVSWLVGVWLPEEDELLEEDDELELLEPGPCNAQGGGGRLLLWLPDPFCWLPVPDCWLPVWPLLPDC
jgi:hypothetical protein